MLLHSGLDLMFFFIQLSLGLTLLDDTKQPYSTDMREGCVKALGSMIDDVKVGECMQGCGMM